MRADVADLDTDQMGMIVATTLDGMTTPQDAAAAPLPPPSVDELIAAAQQTLTKMGITGQLASRKEEIIGVYRELTAEDEATAATPASGVAALTHEQIGLIVAMALDGMTAPCLLYTSPSPRDS